MKRHSRKKMKPVHRSFFDLLGCRGKVALDLAAQKMELMMKALEKSELEIAAGGLGVARLDDEALAPDPEGSVKGWICIYPPTPPVYPQIVD